MSGLLLLEQTLNGIQLGVLLFLMASGLTLVLGIMNVINLAHGSLFMLGAYFVVTFHVWTGSYALAVVLAVAGCFLLGLVLEFLLIRRLYKLDHLYQVLCTFGVILILNEGTRWIWGTQPLRSSIPPWLVGVVEIIPGAPYPIYRLVIIALGLVVALALYLLIGHTRLGMMIRAGASNATIAGALGINLKLLFALIFALGAALAGLAGVAAAPILTVYAGVGDEILILSLVVIVIGGLGSVRGAFVGAILVGVADTLGRAYFRQAMVTFLPPSDADAVVPALTSMLVYGLMALVLFLKPSGLLPAPGINAARITQLAPTTPAQVQPDRLTAAWRAGFVAVAAALLLAFPMIASWAGNLFWVDVVVRILIFSIAALSLDFILGYAGLVSFGHALFLGVGAYAVGILAFHGVTNGFIQWPLALLAAAIVAVLVGTIALRTTGLFFLMITLALAQMFYYVAVGLYAYGGDDGLVVPQRSTFGGAIDLQNRVVFYYVVLAALIGALCFCRRFLDSRFGWVLRGAKSNPRRMIALGFPLFRYQLSAFVIAGVICAGAGILLANATEFVSPSIMHWTRSGDLIIMIVLGGMQTLVGSIVGAFALLGLERQVSAVTVHWQIVVGLLLIGVSLFLQEGLYPSLTRLAAAAYAKTRDALFGTSTSTTDEFSIGRRLP
jgi:branched-chain amino acid transport system permease protein